MAARQQSITRDFDQSSDFTSFYSDFTQVIGTDDEIMLCFYETIAGPPGADGLVTSARSRLRTQVTLSKRGAENLALLITKGLGDGQLRLPGNQAPEVAPVNRAARRAAPKRKTS